jgi:hypothetical protein
MIRFPPKIDRCILFIILFVSPSLLFSQSKEDTQEWIVGMFTSHRTANGFHNYLFDFSEKGMLNVMRRDPNGTVIRTSIILKEIKEVRIEHYKVEDREGYSVYFKCNSRCVFEYLSVKGSIPLNEPDCSFYLDKSLSYDDQPKRLKKALIHLIELNGGKVKEDVF